MKAGNYARYLWFALRDWRGDDPESFFGDLGEWAERLGSSLNKQQAPEESGITVVP